MKAHNDFFSILNSSVTNQQVIDAGYVKGIVRKSLDETQFLVQCHLKLPDALDEFVVVKDKNTEEMRIIIWSDFWTDKTGGINA